MTVFVSILVSQASWDDNWGSGMTAPRGKEDILAGAFATHLQEELSSKLRALNQSTVPLVGNWIGTMKSSGGPQSIPPERFSGVHYVG